MLVSCECKRPPFVKDVIQVIWLLFQQHQKHTPTFFMEMYQATHLLIFDYHPKFRRQQYLKNDTSIKFRTLLFFVCQYS